MKKWLIGSVVGAILLFLWQFLSWAALGLHDKEFKYTPEQAQLLTSLTATLKEDGQYMLPTVAPGASSEEMERVMKESAGKPYALIVYKNAHEVEMMMPMIRAFLVDLVIALLLIHILSKRNNLTMGTVWMGSLAVGFVGWLWNPYMMHIWFQTPTEVITGALMDWFVAYSLVGIWLGFWLKRN